MVSINLPIGGYEKNKILNNVNVDFKKGKFTAIIGPNGSGKTTLLRYLIRELKTQDKNVLIDNKDINSYSQKELAKKVGFLGQYSALDAGFTVEEVIGFGRYCHEDTKQNKEAIQKALDTVQINHLRNKMVTEISGGEFQLVMLARVLCQDTDIILLDEPSNNLDPKHNLTLMTILKNEVKKGKTVIAVLHDLNSVLQFADYTVMIKNGGIIKTGKTEKVVTEKNVEKLFGVKCKINLYRDNIPSAFCYNL